MDTIERKRSALFDACTKCAIPRVKPAETALSSWVSGTGWSFRLAYNERITLNEAEDHSMTKPWRIFAFLMAASLTLLAGCESMSVCGSEFLH